MPTSRSATTPSSDQPRADPKATDEQKATEEPSRPNIVVSSESACRERLTLLGVRFAPHPPIKDHDCEIADPIDVTALDVGIALKPEATLTCPAAEALARWALEAVAPRVKADLAGDLAGLEIAGSYGCRTRNGQAGAPMSEHSLGNAVDIAAFEIGPKRRLAMKPAAGEPQAEMDWRASVRRAACSYFSTVLGPGADPEHADHLHLDVKDRNNGYRICE